MLHDRFGLSCRDQLVDLGHAFVPRGALKRKLAAYTIDI